MARKRKALPSYLHHKQSGQARVRINGKDYLLGPYDSDESRFRYGELVKNHAGGVPIDPVADSNRGRLPRNESDDPGPSVGELCLVFLRHAETHYVKNGKQTSEVHILKSVISPLNKLYGMLPAKDFGPLALKAVRVRMIELGWCRDTVNAGMSRIRRIFKHAIANELIDGSLLLRLQCVAPLLQGRTEAHDNAPRTAVDSDGIATVKKLVSTLVGDLIDLQRLTGSRSGELIKLTTGAINRRIGDVWSAQLGDHKAVHHGKSRTLKDIDWEAESRSLEGQRQGRMDLKAFTLFRDGHRCRQCGTRVKPETSETDHIKPVHCFASYEQATFLLNLQTLCLECHKRKTRAS